MWLLIGPTVAAAQEGPDRFRTMLDSVAPGLLAEHEVAGLVIAYLDDGVPALTTGYGFVDPSSGQAMTASTPLNVQSPLVGRDLGSRQLQGRSTDIALDQTQIGDGMEQGELVAGDKAALFHEPLE